MPLMFGYITLTVPSGLTLYWTASNILSIVPQYFITGWGSLADWIPALKPKGTTLVGVPEAPPPTTAAAPPTAPARPKRRRRRK
jgi:YidC/Oxa1 family membrane protein insertase